MENKTNLISVIIPVYNNEKYIESAIKSVIKQTYKTWELLIVDDVSTDRTVKKIKKYLKKDSRIRLIKHKINKGRAGALNTGIKNSMGDFICFLDSDDIYLKNKLKKQIEFLNKNKKIDMVYSDYLILSKRLRKKKGKTIEFKDFSEPLKRLKKLTSKETKNIGIWKLLWKNRHNKTDEGSIPSCSPMIRKKVFSKILLDEKLKNSEDYDLWFQIIGKGYKIKKLNFYSYLYRINKNQKSKNSKNMEKARKIIEKKLLGKKYFK